MIFSLSDEEFDNLKELSEKYDISKSGILRIGLSFLVHRNNAHHKIFAEEGKYSKSYEVTYRKRKSS